MDALSRQSNHVTEEDDETIIMLPEDMFILLIATDLRNKIATATDTDELTVTTHELNIMHSGHVRPPSIILLYLSSFHPMKTPVLCMVLIYFLWYIILCPNPFTQLLYMRYP